MKALLALIVGAIVVVGIVYFSGKTKNPSINQTVSKTTTMQNLPTSEATTEITATPIPTTVGSKSTASTTTSSGPVEGTLTCTYQTPALPNNFGTAKINSSWSSLVYGKNGYKADLCVSTNGGATQTLMTSKTKVSGTATDYANWISLSSNYIFTLFDEQGGNLPECGGTYLASCQVHTWQLPTVKPI